MKNIHVILIILVVTALFPFQVFAQGAEAFKQEGIASWYGREFEGRPTASGEIFNASQLTAAHPNLPFGTVLVVTNLHNNKSVTVRINDRGPFVPARIIDVSRAAAEQLDMIVTGTAPVKIESVDRIVTRTSPIVGAQMAAPAAVTQTVAPTQNTTQSVTPILSAPILTQTVIPGTTAAPAASNPSNQPAALNSAAVSNPNYLSSSSYSSVTPVQPVVIPVPIPVRLIPSNSVDANKNYRLQVGSFKIARHAVDAFDRLKNAGLNPAYERFSDSNNGEFYRVVLSGIRGSDVPAASEKIGAAGFREALIREEN